MDYKTFIQSKLSDKPKPLRPQLALRKNNVGIAGWRYLQNDGSFKLSFSLSVGRTDKAGKWQNRKLNLSEKEFFALRDLIIENFKKE